MSRPVAIYAESQRYAPGDRASELRWPGDQDLPRPERAERDSPTRCGSCAISKRAAAASCPGCSRPTPTQLRIVTTNCGSRVEHLDEERTQELFAELEPYGVRHDDPDMRNVTYRQSDGRFCVIDFEFATLLPGSEADAAA